MIDKSSAPRVFFPRTINEALELTLSEPNAVFWAGGTSIAKSTGQRRLIELPRSLISLGMIEELARASRSEFNLEIGSMMSLDRIASIGRSALPAALPDALASIGNRPLRCRATLGGHLANSSKSADLRALLHILDAVVETRFLRERKGRRKPLPSTRKLSLSRLDTETGLRAGEILTKIIIPVRNWNYGVYHKIFPDSDHKEKFIFTAVARIEKGILIEWRMALSDSRNIIIRDRELEIALAGKQLPMTLKELDFVDDLVESTSAGAGMDAYTRRASKNLARAFLRNAAG